jgi:hypothetical protein
MVGCWKEKQHPFRMLFSGSYRRFFDFDFFIFFDFLAIFFFFAMEVAFVKLNLFLAKHMSFDSLTILILHYEANKI